MGVSGNLDRYESFRNDGEVKPIPGIFLPPSNTDKRDVYKKTKTRLDKWSMKYYGTPYYGFLILAANPQYGGIEFNIPDNTILRVPFPFKTAVETYRSLVLEHINRYGE